MILKTFSTTVWSVWRERLTQVFTPRAPRGNWQVWPGCEEVCGLWAGGARWRHWSLHCSIPGHSWSPWLTLVLPVKLYFYDQYLQFTFIGTLPRLGLLTINVWSGRSGRAPSAHTNYDSLLATLTAYNPRRYIKEIAKQTMTKIEIFFWHKRRWGHYQLVSAIFIQSEQ